MYSFFCDFGASSQKLLHHSSGLQTVVMGTGTLLREQLHLNQLSLY